MSAFLSGADVSCGPSSVLKNVNGRLDRDVSLQQDRLISTPNVASSSRNAFRPPPTSFNAPRQAAQAAAPPAFDVSQLAQHLPPAQYQSSPPPFDARWASGFRPSASSSQARPHLAPMGASGRSMDSGWAQQFDPGRASSTAQPQQQAGSSRSTMMNTGAAIAQNRPPWARMQPRMQYHAQPPISMMQPMPMQEPVFGPPPPVPMSMEAEREALSGKAQSYYDPALSNTIRSAFAQQHPEELRDILDQLQDGQAELARREREQLERGGQAGQEEGRRTTEGEAGEMEWSGDFSHTSTNQLDDAARQARGEEAVPHVDWQDDTPTDLVSVLNIPPPIPSLLPVRPGGQTVFNQATQDELFGDQNAILMADNGRMRSVHFDDTAQTDVAPLGNGVPSSLEEALHHATIIPGGTSSWEETAFQDDADLDLESFDQDAFMQFNGYQRVQPDSRIGVGAMEGWGEMQKDWDRLQETMPSAGKGVYKGMAVDDRYLFQSRNPYSQAAAEAERIAEGAGHVGRESPTLKGVLELEAEVQADPTDHEAWYALGLKQQENEREAAAINALAKVVQLDPDYRPAYLALAVSYTNEGSVEAANAMLAKWIQLDGQSSASHPYAELEGGGEGMTDKARQEHLVHRLVDIARARYANGDGELDADVQVALGVLFNASEEWDKARDCFEAALEARPDDWLLYNRLGATLANGGKSQEALAYYYRALELHPNFVRALFNLGISHMNLAQYPQAAQRVLDALRLQQADATEGYAAGTVGKAAKGVTSDALWNSLRNACLHMGRSDLVALATRRDLGAFPADVAVQGDDRDELR